MNPTPLRAVNNSNFEIRLEPQDNPMDSTQTTLDPQLNGHADSENVELPNSSNLDFIEIIYADYERDPDSVPPDWQRYFQSLDNVAGPGSNGATQLGPTFETSSIFNPSGVSVAPINSDGQAALTIAAKERQEAVTQLIRNYRVRGHLLAQLDPLGRDRKYDIPELDPLFYGSARADMDRVFACDRSLEPTGKLPLRELIERLKNTYSRTIGVQFTHIDDIEAHNWLQQRMESTQNRAQLSRPEQIRI